MACTAGALSDRIIMPTPWASMLATSLVLDVDQPRAQLRPYVSAEHVQVSERRLDGEVLFKRDFSLHSTSRPSVSLTAVETKPAATAAAGFAASRGLFLCVCVGVDELARRMFVGPDHHLVLGVLELLDVVWLDAAELSEHRARLRPLPVRSERNLAGDRIELV